MLPMEELMQKIKSEFAHNYGDEFNLKIDFPGHLFIVIKLKNHENSFVSASFKNEIGYIEMINVENHGIGIGID